jgi:hypothetical protein
MSADPRASGCAGHVRDYRGGFLATSDRSQIRVRLLAPDGRRGHASAIAEAEKRGAVKALRMADDRLLTERDELRAVRARHGWPMGVEDAARTVRSLADHIESGEVTL